MSKPKKPRRSNTPPWAPAAGYLAIGGVDDDLKWQITRKDTPVFERVHVLSGPNGALVRLVPRQAELRVQAGNGTVRSFSVDDTEGMVSVEIDDLAGIALANVFEIVHERMLALALAQLAQRKR